MRKYLKIIWGYLILLKEEVLSGFKIRIHGIKYCLNTGVKFWVHDGGQLDLGSKTWLSEYCIVECGGGKIRLGYNNFFNTNCRVVSINEITIGDNNLFGPNVVIVDHKHNFSNREELICRQGLSSEPVSIGSNVWIGANVTICAGVKICNNVVVGANSLVKGNLLEPGLYVGVPAKIIERW